MRLFLFSKVTLITVRNERISPVYKTNLLLFYARKLQRGRGRERENHARKERVRVRVCVCSSGKDNKEQKFLKEEGRRERERVGVREKGCVFTKREKDKDRRGMRRKKERN